MNTRILVSAFVSAFVLASQAQAQAAPRYGRRPAAATTTTSATTVTTTATTPNIDVAQAPVSNAPNGGARRALLNWDAFIDVQALLPSNDATADKGVTLNDAALYLAKDYSRGTAIVDLPFRSTLTPGIGNEFAFARQKAQAYAHVNFGALGLRLGQYDSFFGIEANDSVARFFADQGLLKALGIVPLTHTGGQAIFGLDRFTIRGQIANANSTGTMAGADPEVGAQVRFDANGAFVAVGAEYGTFRTNASDKTNLLFEAMGGMVINRLNLGAQIDLRKLSGVTGGNTIVTGADKTGLGIGILGAFDLTDVLSLGGRIDFIKDQNVILASTVGGSAPRASLPGAGLTTGVVDTGFLVSFGPSYKLENDLTLRSDLSIANFKGAGLDEDTIFGLTLSLVARL